MTLRREHLAYAAREAIASRHVGYRTAIEKTVEMQRNITPEALLELLDKSERCERNAALYTDEEQRLRLQRAIDLERRWSSILGPTAQVEELRFALYGETGEPR